MQSILPLEEGGFYHVYNRGINGENLFKEARNYAYFLRLYAKYLEPVAQTFSYCLLPNHFHLLIRVKTLEERVLEQNPGGLAGPLTQVSRITASRAFSHFFNSYAQSINKSYNRTGGLFESPFRRKAVTHPAYFQRLVYYIHANPQHHGLIEDFREYPYSSYHSLLDKRASRLQRATVLTWFDSEATFQYYHTEQHDMRSLQDLLIEFD